MELNQLNQEKLNQIKELINKIDLQKINSYLEKNPKSRTLKLLRNFIKRIKDNKNPKHFRLAKKIAYFLNVIIKENYVLEENDKKNYLEISQELFKNTIGLLKKIKVLFCFCGENPKKLTQTGGILKEKLLLKKTEIKILDLEKYKCLECAKEILLVETQQIATTQQNI